jgi:hypothetical protein
MSHRQRRKTKNAPLSHSIPEAPKELSDDLKEIVSILEGASNFGNRRTLQGDIIKLRTSRHCTDLVCIESVIQRERWKAICAKAHEIQRGSSHDAQLMYEIAFHGTRVENVPKILKNGFFVLQRRKGQGGSGD